MPEVHGRSPKPDSGDGEAPSGGESRATASAPPPVRGGRLGSRDVPRELRVGFWSVVVLFNVAVFGVTVGPIVWYLGGDLRIGGALLAVGIFATVRGLMRYRQLRASEA